MTPIEFLAFPKMARLSREAVITEKIDGTNAAIVIGPGDPNDPHVIATRLNGCAPDWVMKAQSRNRFITPGDDNYGFAAWAVSNAESLFELGEGRHFGEWWGKGIARNYGLAERRFSLFNTQRWGETRPSCCHVVPVLWRGNFDTNVADFLVSELRKKGSLAAPGFMKPEGIIVFHTAAGIGFKKTLEHDEKPKSQVARG